MQSSLGSTANFRYLIIAGVPKAATSFLFHWLSKHPQICGSYIKETNFFIEPEYFAGSRAFRGDYSYLEGYEAYNRYFRDCSRADLVRLDASPHYLYSRGTASRINEALPDSRIVFSLREPISRLISWYRYGVQRAKLDRTISFDEFVAIQRRGENSGLMPYRALREGLYANYLPAFYDVFGPGRIRVTFFESIAGEARAILRDICSFAGLSEFQPDASLSQAVNRSQSVRFPKVLSAYNTLRHTLRHLTYRTPLHRYLQGPSAKIKSGLTQLLAEPVSTPLTMSEETRAFLRTYYYGQADAELERLSALIGAPVPWNLGRP